MTVWPEEEWARQPPPCLLLLVSPRTDQLQACGDHVVKVKSLQASIYGKTLKEETIEKVVNKYLSGEGGGGVTSPAASHPILKLAPT
jgi:hypothetical protein